MTDTSATEPVDPWRTFALARGKACPGCLDSDALQFLDFNGSFYMAVPPVSWQRNVK